MAIRIEAPASVTIRSVAGFADTLINASTAGGPVEVDLDALEDCDLSLAQILLSARNTMSARGGQLTLAQPAPPPLAKLLARAGMAGAQDAADHDFWFHGDAPQ